MRGPEARCYRYVMNAPVLLSGFLGFASGILCRSLFVFPASALILPGILVTSCFVLFLVRRRAPYVVCTVFILGALLGSGRVFFAPSALPEAFTPLLGTEVSLEGTVVVEPDIRETTQRVTLLIESEGVKTKVLAVAPRYPEVAYGARIQAEGRFALPEPFGTDGGRTFRYDRFLAKDGVFALVEFGRVEVLTPPEGILARGMASLLSVKHAFQQGLSAALPEPNASLASGLITGGKQGLGEALLEAFVVAGLVHIVVLSGYNVMIVAEGVLRSLAFLPKRTAALVALSVITAFVFVAGAGPASVRAGFMAALALIARATGRTYAVLRALLIVAFVMLLMNPLLLAYDPGFQLSFLATLGLILGSPILSARLAFVRSAFWRELLSATLGAQLSVLPLILYQTGLLSFISLPANLVVLPSVPLAMLLSAVAGVAGMIVPAAAPFVGLPAHALLSFIVASAEFAAAFPGASATLPAFPFPLVLVMYGALALVTARAARP
jgi:competence protein ComEC